MKQWLILILSLLFQTTINAQKQDTATLKYENKDLLVSWQPLPLEKNGKYTYHLFIKNKTRGFILLKLSDLTMNGQPIPGVFYGEKETEIPPGMGTGMDGRFFIDIDFPKPPTATIFLNGYTRYTYDTSYRERFLLKTDTQTVASSICEFKYSNFLTDRDQFSNMLIMIYTNVKKDFVIDFTRAALFTKEKVKYSFQVGQDPCLMVRKGLPPGGLGVPAFFFYVDKKVTLKDIGHIDLSNAILPLQRTYITLHTRLSAKDLAPLVNGRSYKTW